jgi:4-amino-4-deoxy-L-arabinose transferase-like glycosyltransferase
VKNRPHFARWLIGLALLAFAIRLAFALSFGTRLGGDALFYRGVGEALANGKGYTDPGSIFAGHPNPTALHPPLFPIYLASWTKLGLGGVHDHQIVSCLLGGVTVVLVGLLGRRIAGPRVGLIAAGIAGVDPWLFTADRIVNSESLYIPLIVLALVLAYRFLERPTPVRAAVLGLVIGLATLTRSDGILLLLLLAAPLTWRAREGRLRAFAACAAATLVVLTPWLVRNWIQLDQFPLLSTNGGHTELATNCDETYSEQFLGFLVDGCAYRSPCNNLGEEGPKASCMEREARSYVRNHLHRAPLVVLARVERVWEVYDPKLNLEYGSVFWHRPKGWATAGLVFYVLLVPFALAGAFLLSSRHVPLLPLLAMFAQVTLVAAISFGDSRFRAAVEPALVVMAAVAVERLALAVAGAARRQEAPRAPLPAAPSGPRA